MGESSKARHTPGPWEIKRASNGLPYQITAPNGGWNKPGGIGDITRWGSISMPSSPEGEANARLIAAAPQMYEALAEAAQMLGIAIETGSPGTTPAFQRALDAARAALAAAEGA